MFGCYTYPPSDSSWEPLSNLKHVTKLINEYRRPLGGGGVVKGETLFQDFKVPMASITRFAIKQGQAVSETVYEPFVFEDENNLYMVWFKNPKITYTFKALSMAIEVTVRWEAPTKEMIKELSTAIPEGDLSPLEKKFAITLKRRIWQDQGKKVDTNTWSGIQFRLDNGEGEAAIY